MADTPVPATGQQPIRVELSGTDSIADFTYVNHSLVQYTGAEVIIYGAHVHRPHRWRRELLRQSL